MSPPRPAMTLLSSPLVFFSSGLDEKSGWPLSWMGYLLCALCALLGFDAVAVRIAVPSEYFFNLAIYSLAGGVIAVVSIGLLWMWGLARLLGGRAGLTRTLKASGLALFWPGLVASLLNLAIVLYAYFGQHPNSYVVLGLQVATMAWYLLVLGACVRGLNGFALLRLIVAVLLPPLLIIAFVSVTGGSLGGPH